MVNIIIPHCKKHEGIERNGGIVPPFRPSPHLETPDLLPQHIIIDGHFKSKRTEYITSSADPHLTEYLNDIVLSNLASFNRKIVVEYVTSPKGNFPILNTMDGQFAVAIGARCEMLHNQFGIGSHIMYLLDRSPVWIMTPHEIDECLKIDCESRTEGSELFPDWVAPKKMDILPDNLPSKLFDILKLCEQATSSPFHVNYYKKEEEYDIGRWPFVTCAWYGFEPYIGKRLKRATLSNYNFRCGPDARFREILSRNKDQGQGTDPTWFVLDNLIVEAQEYMEHTCMPIYHELDSVIDALGSFRPFCELINYLNHGKY